MTINQIIYNIRNIIKDNRSDDIKISDRQLEYIINYVRARLIKQEVDKGKTISSNVKQDLGIVELERIDNAESNSVTINRYILRSTKDIPKAIELNYKEGITYIGGVNKVSPFQFTTKAASHWSKYNKYTGNRPYAYKIENRVYIQDCNKILQYINIEGIFEDPREASKFKKEDGSPCYNPNIDDYPISSYMIQPLTELIVTKELNTFLRIPEDIRNDASDQIRTQ